MYRRRLIIFLTIVAIAMTTLIARLGYLQVVGAEKYLNYAKDRLRRIKLIPAMRGRILDRQGRILAYDKPCYDLSVKYAFLDNAATARWVNKQLRSLVENEGLDPAAPSDASRLEEMSRILTATGDEKWMARRLRIVAREQGLDLKNPVEAAHAGELLAQRIEKTWELLDRVAARHGENSGAAVGKIKRRIRAMRGKRKYKIREEGQFHPVVSGLDEAEAVAIRAELAGTIGTEIRPSHQRRYPAGETACHVVGLTGRVTVEHLASLNRPKYEPNWLNWQRDSYLHADVIGTAGVEKMCETLLRGRRGYREYHAGKLIGEEAAEPGSDVHLTLDLDLQERIGEAFRARHPSGTGAVVVLDVPTGEVLALVSIPTYDLNTYRQNFSQLVRDTTGLPLRNRAVISEMAPGSTVKPIAALAALGAGKITKGTRFRCAGGQFPLSPDGRPKCWIYKYGGEHGTPDLIEALRFSCNPYFAHVGHELGPYRLTEWYRMFGFGAVCGTGLPEEVSGVLADDARMQRDQGRRMNLGDAWNMAIGQGTFSASPLHVANAMATIARGGKFRSPIVSLEGGPERVRRDLPLSEAQIQAVWEGMRQVVHHSRGTAHKVLMKNGLQSLGFQFCGKTGTSQVPPQRVDSDGDGRITGRDRIVRQGDVAWFAGFAPHGRPQIAFAVMVEYVQGGGGRNAGPVAMDVLKICREKGYLP